jgi:3-hydroxyacyl-CoA dehydrogenase/enoyl-CoA hydratase/3-hydroxybutyryl-CoA epimerase
VSGAFAFAREIQDGVLLLTLDLPGEKVNTLSRAVLAEFLLLLPELEARPPDIRAVVLRSGKPDTFIAGADIRDFLKIRSAFEGETLSRGGQAILDRLERLPLPVVAAIHGACLGGGLETVLACRYRVASDDPHTVLGLPEVKLGLLPGAGGTQRLPRVAGLATALDLILSGRSLKASRALAAGLVDEVVPAPILLDVAKARATALADATLLPARRGIRWQEKLLRPVLFRKARRSVRARTDGHYPAPLKAIDVVRDGTAMALAEGLKLEAQAFGELSASDVSRALVSLFFATQDVKKDPGYPEGTLPREVRKLGVLGAGLMGAGIGGAAADAGIPVRLKDTNAETLGRGLRHAREVLEERRRRGSLTALELQQRIDRISPSLDYSGFRRADLVIEAVFEDLEVKRRVLQETEGATGDECVFASNTSALPIGEIARGARRPSRVLGMHFFSPVHRMPLVEVAVTAETDAWAAATAVAFGRRLGKHVIVVRDGPGFYTTRALAPYLAEGCRLLEEGARIEDVDRALVAFGFPVGPLALLDEVGIDVAAKVARFLHERFGPRLAPPPSMARLIEDSRLGRKNRRGFYRYDGDRKRPDETVYALLPAGGGRRDWDAREIQERLVFALLNEAAHCLQDGVLRSPRDGDVGAIFGLGFPPFLGGPFRYLDLLGPPFASEELERLRDRHGERYTPAALLAEMAAGGKSFHD